MPFWSRLKLGPRRSISETKHQKDSDSSPITNNIGDRRSLIPCLRPKICYLKMQRIKHPQHKLGKNFQPERLDEHKVVFVEITCNKWTTNACNIKLRRQIEETIITTKSSNWMIYPQLNVAIGKYTPVRIVSNESWIKTLLNVVISKQNLVKYVSISLILQHLKFQMFSTTLVAQTTVGHKKLNVN